jgi:hypothetical protein
MDGFSADSNASLAESARIPTAVFEIENHFGEDNGRVHDIQQNHSIEVDKHFIDDARNVPDEHQSDIPDAQTAYGLGADGFCNGKRPAASEAKQHHRLKNTRTDDIHSASFPAPIEASGHKLR